MLTFLHINTMQNNEIYRIVDANVNRASEALRVLEDWARFALKQALSPEPRAENTVNEKLKRIRHEINKVFNQKANLIFSRDSVNDIGRNLEINNQRQSVRDIIRANCKRIEESLRVLFEYGQLLQINTKVLEELRYEIYTLEKELIVNEKLIRLNNAKLYLITNRKTHDGSVFSDKEFFSILEKALEGGVDVIQLREKEEKEKRIIELGKEIKKMVLNTNVLFIINDRVDLALACDADGVHLGQNDLPLNEARKITPEGFLIGLSTHNIEQGEGSRNFFSRGLVDYVGVGPVFATPTKPDYKPAGLEYVKWAVNHINIPWFAIGGIDITNVEKVLSCGAERISIVRAIMNSKNPLQSTKELKEILSSRKEINIGVA